MVFVGTSVVAAAVLAGAQAGLWQVAVVWALGVSMAIYLTGAVSGAHLNPAVSLAFAIFRPRDFPIRMLVPYWVSQLLGAVLAGLTVFTLYRSFIRNFETEHGIERGDPGSQLSTMMFGEYFPNPGMMGVGEGAGTLISPLGAAAVEALGTGILVLMIFALVDRRNTSLPVKYLAPVFIGLTVAMMLAPLISMLAPLTMGGWNPARDFGPRLVSYFAGWGEVAIPGPSGRILGLHCRPPHRRPVEVWAKRGQSRRQRWGRPCRRRRLRLPRLPIRPALPKSGEPERGRSNFHARPTQPPKARPATCWGDRQRRDLQDPLSQGRVAVQLGPAPATGSSLLVGVGGIIPLAWRRYDSTLEKPSMSSDPNLPRFGRA